jgi:hypothetical protein
MRSSVGEKRGFAATVIKNFFEPRMKIVLSKNIPCHLKEKVKEDPY